MENQSDEETKPDVSQLKSMSKVTIVLNSKIIERSRSNRANAFVSNLTTVNDPCTNSPTVISAKTKTKEETKNLDVDEHRTDCHNDLDINPVTKTKHNRPKVNPDKQLTDIKKKGRPAKVRTAEEKLRLRNNYNWGVCTVCGKYSKSMYQHMKSHSKIDESVECDYCHRKLIGKRNLTKHFKYHFKERFVVDISILTC